MSKKLNLYNALEASYKSVPDAKKELAKYDYYVNEGLSTADIKVAFNPVTKKLLFLVAGTKSLADVGTDVYLAAGKLKDTTRYKQAKELLIKAKKAYGVDTATIAGHSLGGTIASYIGSKKDKTFTYNKGATFGQGSRPNEVAIRSAGDIVSVLASRNKNIKTLAPTIQQDLSGYSERSVNSLFQPHDLSNLSRGGNQNIFLDQTRPEPTAMPVNQQSYQGNTGLRGLTKAYPVTDVTSVPVKTSTLRGFREEL